MDGAMNMMENSSTGTQPQSQTLLAKEFANGDVVKERAYLDSIAREPLVNLGFKKFPYLECKERELNLGLDLQFIIKNPMCVCPGCGVILDFSVNDEIKEKYSDAMRTINTIKSKYKDIAKFGSK